MQNVFRGTETTRQEVISKKEAEPAVSPQGATAPAVEGIRRVQSMQESVVDALYDSRIMRLSVNAFSISFLLSAMFMLFSATIPAS